MLDHTAAVSGGAEQSFSLVQRSNTGTNEPLDAWVVVTAIVSFLDVLFGISQFQGQSLTPQLQVRAYPPLLLVALHPDGRN